VSARPQPLPVQHYVIQGDAARLDLMARHGAYVEIGEPGQSFYGWVYFDREAETPWRAGFQVNGAQATQESFDDMREGFDWVVAGMPS
jgi:hypothetical protein